MASDPRDDHDIDLWLARLAGRSPQGEPDREAQVLRRAVLAQAEASAPAADAAADAAAWERLRFRLRREGLAGRGAAPMARRWMPAAAAAVLVLGVAVSFWSRQSTGPQEVAVIEDAAPVFRGGPQPTVVMVADPSMAARQAALALRRQQVQATVYVQPGQAVVDFEADPAALDALRQSLRPQAPDAVLRPGLNRLVFRKN